MIGLKYNDKEIIDFVYGFYKKSKEYKEHIGIIDKTIINIAFILGYQNYYYDRSTNSFLPVHPENANKVISNQILPIVQQRLSRINANLPKWEFEPDTIDEDTEQQARIVESIITKSDKTIKAKLIRKEILYWLSVSGNSWTKTFFNNQKGDFFLYGKDKDGNVHKIFNEQDKEKYEKYGFFYKGQEETVVHNIFETFWDTDLNRFEDANKILFVKKVSQDFIREKFGHSVSAEMQADKTDVYTSSSSFGRMFNSFANIFSSSAEESNETRVTANLYEYWESSSPSNPFGKLIYILNDKIIYNGINPTPGYSLPIVHYVDFRASNQLCAEPLVTHLIPLQNEYNSIRSQMDNLRRKCAYFTIITDTDTEIEWEQEKDIGALIMKHSAVSKDRAPQILNEYSQALSGLTEQLQIVTLDMENISGIHEISQGRAPGGVRAASALAYLGEKDETRIRVVIDEYEESIIAEAKIRLKIIKANYDPLRLSLFIGKNRNIEDILKMPDFLIENITMRPSSTLPKNIVEKREYAVLFKDILPQEAIMKMLEFGGLEDYYGQEEIDIEKARLENQKMSNGMLAPVEMWDNHITELRVHTNYIKSKCFHNKLLLLAKEDISKSKYVYEMFKQHIQLHTQMVAGTMNPQAGGQQGGQEQQMQEIMQQQM